MSEKKLTIGLFGFGVVGEGIYRVLKQTPSLQATIRKICIKHEWKKRDLQENILTTFYDDILEDPDINVVVELIDDADEAFKIVSKALRKGKSVVSANKKLIAEHLPELLKLQERYQVPFLYEAAVCGSIPIIRNLEEYYDNDLLQAICGIVNGSTNYILTKIIDEGVDYREALLQAQQLGFAESDPTLDVEGIDAANKLTILLAHAYGILLHPNDILYKGISQVQLEDASIAEEKSYQVKLTAQARKLSNGKVAAFVLPQFVTSQSQLYGVKNEFNGVVIESSFSDKQFLYGKGAGRYPTSSAVLSDISALRYQYKYEYRKLNNPARPSITNDFYLKLYVSFDEWSDIDREDFEWIEEFHSNENRQYVIGVIHVKKLKESRWFSNKTVSSIVCPDGIIENLDLRKIRKRSLELAGVL
jgi:homoserine dehydrogenase